MISITRMASGRTPPFEIKMVRQTPAIVPDSAGKTDYFCLGDPAQATDWPVVPVHDGWYADDATGGMAIWGQGLFWGIRSPPFTVAEACGPEASLSNPRQNAGDEVNVRQAIFRG